MENRMEKVAGILADIVWILRQHCENLTGKFNAPFDLAMYLLNEAQATNEYEIARITDFAIDELNQAYSQLCIIYPEERLALKEDTK